MISNPLLRLRWSLLERTILKSQPDRGAPPALEAIEGLRAQLDAVRPVLEAAPGVYDGALALMLQLIAEARTSRLLIKLQVSELALAYVMVQSLYFSAVQRERALTLEERQFGQDDLDSLMHCAMELVNVHAPA